MTGLLGLGKVANIAIPLGAGLLSAMSPAGQRGVNTLAQMLLLQQEAEERRRGREQEEGLRRAVQNYLLSSGGPSVFRPGQAGGLSSVIPFMSVGDIPRVLMALEDAKRQEKIRTEDIDRRTAERKEDIDRKAEEAAEEKRRWEAAQELRKMGLELKEKELNAALGPQLEGVRQIQNVYNNLLKDRQFEMLQDPEGERTRSNAINAAMMEAIDLYGGGKSWNEAIRMANQKYNIGEIIASPPVAVPVQKRTWVDKYKDWANRPFSEDIGAISNYFFGGREGAEAQEILESPTNKENITDEEINIIAQTLGRLPNEEEMASISRAKAEGESIENILRRYKLRKNK